MKKFIFSFLICALFAAACVHANLQEELKENLVGYLQSFHVKETEAELKAKELPDLIEMAIEVLTKDRDAEQDPAEAATLQKHINHYESLKAEIAKRNRVSKVHHVQSEEDFDAKLNSAGDKLVVVDFYATWCGPCNNLAPRLVDLADKYESQVFFMKVDSDQQSNLAYRRFNVFAMPTIIYFKNGQQVEQYSDANVGRMEDTINRLLN